MLWVHRAHEQWFVAAVSESQYGKTVLCSSGSPSPLTLKYGKNGSDGKTEQGGRLDVFDIATNSWGSHTFEAGGKAGPGARSVSV